MRVFFFVKVTDQISCQTVVIVYCCIKVPFNAWFESRIHSKCLKTILIFSTNVNVKLRPIYCLNDSLIKTCVLLIHVIIQSFYCHQSVKCNRIMVMNLLMLLHEEREKETKSGRASYKCFEKYFCCFEFLISNKSFHFTFW